MVSTTMPINLFYVRLGVRITALRQKAGYTRKDFGAMVGYSGSMITMIEQGKRDLNLQKFARMATVLGVSADYLLTGKTK